MNRETARYLASYLRQKMDDCYSHDISDQVIESWIHEFFEELP